MASTQALIESCHIGTNTYVLDIGCGVGMPPCHIAKTYLVASAPSYGPCRLMVGNRRLSTLG
jgi:cyclopropane fatty-acyl-phospholipid synthase-like methyltransferase